MNETKILVSEKEGYEIKSDWSECHGLVKKRLMRNNASAYNKKLARGDACAVS